MTQKESGVLLHITSLPGKYGCGKLGKEAFKFIDFLRDSGFSYWEILPINDTGYLFSPFLATTAFGHNHLLIDYDDLIERELLNSRDFTNIDFGNNPRVIDYENLIKVNYQILKKAFKRFDKKDPSFLEFKENDYIFYYCLYKVIKDHNNGVGWFDYSLEDRYYTHEVRDHYLKNYSQEIDFYLFLEYIFSSQWEKLHSYAKKNNIDLIGDVPHFLGYDSDALYFNPELFLVDKRNLVTYVAGFPPDNFSPNGQKWGYPIYDWEYMELNNYKWWKMRINYNFKFFDRIKLNHIRGFFKTYIIPFRAKNAKHGTYYKGPGIKFIEEIKKENSNLIASNIGLYEKEVVDFVKESNLPYNSILIPRLFENIMSPTLPSQIEENCYFYLGNHDNDPIKVKLEELSDKEKEELISLMKDEAYKLNVNLQGIDNSSQYELAFSLIELLFASKAEHITLSPQDFLFKGKEARMNKPGTLASQNWTYRFLSYEFSDDLKTKFFNLNKNYLRLNKKNF